MTARKPMPRYIKGYLARVALFMAAYMLILFGGRTYAMNSDPSQIERIALAIMTALPICGVFWSVFRLLVDIDDEYQRLLFAKQILFGTAWALAIVTIWEFLAVYDVLADGPRWTGAIWFATFGLAGGFVRWRA